VAHGPRRPEEPSRSAYGGGTCSGRDLPRSAKATTRPRLLPALTAALLLAACSDPAPRTEPAAGAESAAEQAARLTVWFDEKFEEELQFSPIRLTFLGRKDRQAEIDDLSVAGEQAKLEWKAATVEELRREFDYDTLPPALQESWDIWVYQYEIARDGVPFRNSKFAFDQMRGQQSRLPTMLMSFHAVDEVEDLEAQVARFAASARAVDQLIERGRAAFENGVRTPRFALEGVIDQARKVITGAPFTDGEASALWDDFETELAKLLEAEKLSDADAETLRQTARIALTEQFQPAWERIIAWAEDELEHAPAVSTGLSGREDGAAYYEYLLRLHTTTDLTADEIHEIGLAEVTRIRGEMEAIKEEVGFEGDLRAFFDLLRDSKEDERFYFPDTDEGRQAYIDEATAAIERIKAQLPDFFGILPRADLVVKRVEPFREQDGAAQHYFPSTPDGSRPGVYYAHLSDMTAMPKRELEVVAYHEGLPGHHMQIAIARELEGLPEFRTQAFFNAYVEGWGLYSESLATEFDGTYEDPYSEFGRLGTEMWRAVRLVVDTGLHAKGWTEEQAFEYFLENAAITEAQARSEVRRYIVMPGQATSYKIGMLKIQELRARAEEALGDDFDIRAFHDVILGGGAMPLTILERRVDRWISTKAAS
jgi:uncharacterized protein (DUF885 family)